MKLNKTDYMLECTSDGGYYAWLTVNMQCNAYGGFTRRSGKKPGTDHGRPG